MAPNFGRHTTAEPTITLEAMMGAMTRVMRRELEPLQVRLDQLKDARPRQSAPRFQGRDRARMPDRGYRQEADEGDYRRLGRDRMARDQDDSMWGIKLKITASQGNANPWRQNFVRREDKPPMTTPTAPKPRVEPPTPKPASVTEPSTSRARDITCVRCQGLGHEARQCPNQRVMTLCDDGLVESEDEEEMAQPVCGEAEIEKKEEDHGIREVLGPKHSLTLQVQEVEDLRTNPFQEEENDANMAGLMAWLADPLQVPDGPTTRAKAKAFREALNGLVKEVAEQTTLARPIEELRVEDGLVHSTQAYEGEVAHAWKPSPAAAKSPTSTRTPGREDPISQASLVHSSTAHEEQYGREKGVLFGMESYFY